MNKNFFFGFAIAASFFGSAASAAVVGIDMIPSGTTVDLSGFSTGTPIAANDPAFTAAGISSITVTGTPSPNNEFYDGGQFGAGRALFGTEAGELIVLDEGASFDFGSPTFTIDLLAPVQSFGLRIADTSNSFATPQIDFFSGGSLLTSFLIDGAFNASTEFGFTTLDSFDQIVINVDTVGTGFGFDGAGITDLTVGGAVTTPAPIPLPAGLPLLLSGLLGIGLLARRKKAA